MKEKDIWVNKFNGNFIEIKEITNYVIDKKIAFIVLSEECRFLNDTRTTVGRQVMNLQVFESTYKSYMFNDDERMKMEKVRRLKKIVQRINKCLENLEQQLRFTKI